MKLSDWNCVGLKGVTKLIIFRICVMQRPLGLISLLDEECMFPRSSDLSLANKLKEHLKGNDCFRGERDKAFRVCHYAGEVFILLELC